MSEPENFESVYEHDDHLSPDCRDLKHRACRGDAWCLITDEQAACACACHAENT